MIQVVLMPVHIMMLAYESTRSLCDDGSDPPPFVAMLSSAPVHTVEFENALGGEGGRQEISY